MRNRDISIESIKSVRAIEFKYMSGKIKVTDTYERPNGKKDMIYLKFDSEFFYMQDQAFQFLIDNKFDVVSRCHQNDNTLLLMVNNWGEDFKSIKDCKR
tara:strand:+ start:358 stop:654 length:297 start_codon:yes stop_codon:yes gene_type:complete